MISAALDARSESSSRSEHWPVASTAAIAVSLDPTLEGYAPRHPSRRRASAALRLRSEAGPLKRLAETMEVLVSIEPAEVKENVLRCLSVCLRFQILSARSKSIGNRMTVIRSVGMERSR